MSLRSPAVNEKPEFDHGSIQNVPPNPSFPHACSGNAGGGRMGPQVKHSWLTAFGSRISLPAATFKGGQILARQSPNQRIRSIHHGGHRVHRGKKEEFGNFLINLFLSVPNSVFTVPSVVSLPRICAHRANFRLQ